MIFEKLPLNIQAAIVALTEDQEFDRRFKADQQLDRIDQLKKNAADHFKLLQTIICGKMVIEGRAYRCPSPASISFLYLVKSPLVFGGGEIAMADLDLFMWATQDPAAPDMFAGNFLEISSGWCEKHQIDVIQLVDDLPEIMRLCFAPFRILPPAPGRELDLGPSWLAALCSGASKASGLPASRLMRGPMTTAAFYFVENIRSNSAKPLFQAADEDLLQMQDRRCCRLVCQYLAEKGVIKAEEIEKYCEMMAPPAPIS